MRHNDPTPSDEALAVFSRSHPGREHEALSAAQKWFTARKGQPCTSPAKYFGAWPPEHLAATIQLATPSRPACSDCAGTGFLEDPETHMPVEACPTCKPERATA